MLCVKRLVSSLTKDDSFDFEFLVSRCGQAKTEEFGDVGTFEYQHNGLQEYTKNI